MLHQTFLFLGQLWQLFEVSQILEFLRYQVFKIKNLEADFVVVLCCYFTSMVNI